MNSYEEFSKDELQNLCLEELNEINGGNLGHDIGYAVGQVVGYFSQWFWKPYTSTAGEEAVMML